MSMNLWPQRRRSKFQTSWIQPQLTRMAAQVGHVSLVLSLAFQRHNAQHTCQINTVALTSRHMGTIYLPA